MTFTRASRLGASTATVSTSVNGVGAAAKSRARSGALALALAATSGLASAGSALAQDQSPVGAPVIGDLTVELNKFEENPAGGCRAYFLFRNQTGKSFDGFEMSLAILDQQGVIDRLLAIDAAPLPLARTTLKLFEIPALSCPQISEVLLHEIPVCKPQNEDPLDCFPFVTLASKTAARLEK